MIVAPTFPEITQTAVKETRGGLKIAKYIIFISIAPLLLITKLKMDSSMLERLFLMERL